jgi:hypothetical protein
LRSYCICLHFGHSTYSFDCSTVISRKLFPRKQFIKSEILVGSSGVNVGPLLPKNCSKFHKSLFLVQSSSSSLFTLKSLTSNLMYF